MGRYIETPPHRFGKADILIKNHGAIEMTTPAYCSGKRITVCVVQNACFEACGLAYDRREFDCFTAPDPRPKRWLSMDRAVIAKMHPEHAEFLALDDDQVTQGEIATGVQ